MIKSYNYILITPFDIFCQQKSKLIFDYLTKTQQVKRKRGTRKAILRLFRVHTKMYLD
jgi:hypothetical protein